MTLFVRQDISGCLEDEIGKAGLDQAALQQWMSRASEQAEALKKRYHDEKMALLHIAARRDDIETAQAAFDALVDGANMVVFLGTGGSSLGGQTIAQLGGWSIPGIEAKNAKALPRTRIFDNLDPFSLGSAIDQLDLSTTRFVVISKSGNTAETLVQAMTVITAFRRAGLGDKIGASLLGLSEARRDGVPNGLRDLLAPFGCAFLEHDPDIGGRFSSLTNVGLLPAMARGLDAIAIRRGAERAVAELLNSDGEASMALTGAAVQVGLYRERGISTSVMMPYANQLSRFGHWYVQLWAESLGKDGRGTTPVAALGPVDQHSQLQLYMDGPKDKLITVVSPETGGLGPRMDEELAIRAGLSFMAGRTVGDLVEAQARATVAALKGAGQPSRFIRLGALSEEVLGYLLMSYMVETILAAGLLGVNAFDQPAVEIGKKQARDYLLGV